MNRPITRLGKDWAPASALEAVNAVATLAFVESLGSDCDGAYPEREVAALRDSGLLQATLPRTLGGLAPTASELAEWLRRIGAGSLPLGRLYEGHVNALELATRCGSAEQAEHVAHEARLGQLFGVWNTDDKRGLRLIPVRDHWLLEGRKILASGAGLVARPLVTAIDETGRRVMVLPRLDASNRADLSSWTAQGMRASATGSFDFTGLTVERGDILGGDGDYERQPYFSGGAWRFCAVQVGGMEVLCELLRQHLRDTGRGGDPHQAARLGEAEIAVETARLWVDRAARMAEASLSHPPDQIVAYVNLARLAVERAALDLIERVHRSVGLQSFMRPNAIERVSRDLATYLRQPAPDRALSNAAAWILQQEGGVHDRWQ